MDEFLAYPLLMEPFFSPRPWGGRRLESRLGKPLPGHEPIGESWELSDHPHGRSRIANGPYAGRYFGDLYAAYPAPLCGAANPPPRFPLLVKYIDASGDLSIQVHPDDAAAARRGDRGKTECWYVMDCDPKAEVIYGLDPRATPGSLRRAAESGRMDGEIRRLPILPGSFLYLPAGVVHAILAGTLICEVQQSSDLTYRLWDWGRQPPRALHLEDALEAARFGSGNAPAIIETADYTGMTTLVLDQFFHVRLAVFEPGKEASPWRLENRRGTIVNVLAGGASWQAPDAAPGHGAGEFLVGQTWFWPAGLGEIKLAPGPAGLRLLVSESLEL